MNIMDRIRKAAGLETTTDTAPNGKGNNPINYNTDEPTEAEKQFMKIGTGKSQAVKMSHRDNNNSTARAFRLLVQRANANGDCIINDGDGAGYYRPNLEDEKELDAAKRYIRSLNAKAMTMQNTAQAMAEAIGGRYMNI